MTTSELLDMFWREYDREPRVGDSLCQCQTEPLIEASRRPMRVRSVLLVSDILVQCLREFGFGRHVDDRPPAPNFTIPFRLAYVGSHGGGGQGPMGWVLRGYDGNLVAMDWRLATTVAVTMIASIRVWMEEDPTRAAVWPRAAERLLEVLGEHWTDDPDARRRLKRTLGLSAPGPARELYLINHDSPSRGLEEVLMAHILGSLATRWGPDTTSRDVARLIERTKRAARLAAGPYWGLDGGPTGKDGQRGSFADTLAEHLRQGQMASRAVELTLPRDDLG